jgi:DNA-binding response OmpR family regulator
MLASLGHESVVVGSTSEARDLFKANLEEGKLYTHVIMDYNLDKMTGLEFARELKLLSPEVFCILISSWGLSPDADLAARMGIDRILKKPFRMEQLAEIIDASRGALH